MAEWFYAQGGQQAGPVDLERLRSLLASGLVSTGDLVWQEGMADWVPAESVPELAAQPSAPPPPAPPLPLQYGQASYAAPRSPLYYAPARSHQGTATTALVLACIGTITCVPAAIVGLIMGINARNAMNRDNSYAGSGLALAAIIVGGLGIALRIAIIIYAVAAR